MRFISHRGNLEGPSDKENSPDQIREALSDGFEVEMDIWYLPETREWFLGHDKPEHKTEIEFLAKTHKFWLHAKNIDTLYATCTQYLGCFILKPNVFFHQNDDVTLTRTGCLWTYPGKKLTPASIAVIIEYDEEKIREAFDASVAGICTDYPIKTRKFVNALQKGNGRYL